MNSVAKAVSSSQAASSSTTNSGRPVDRNNPPFYMVEVCQICWRNGQRVGPDPKRDDKCAGTLHPPPQLPKGGSDNYLVAVCVGMLLSN